VSFLVVLAILTKSIIYGLSVFVTGSLTDSVDVLDVLSIRYIITFSVLLLLRATKIIKINMRFRDIFKRDQARKNLSILLMAGIFEPVLCIFLETAGLSMTTGITAGIIIAFAPIFTCLFERIFLKEKNTLAQKIFLGIGIVGICYVVINTKTGDGENSFLGIALLLGSVVCGQMYAVCTRKVKKVYNGFDTSFVMATLGVTVFNAINIVRHLLEGSLGRYFAPLSDPKNVVAFLYLGIFCSVVATTLGNFSYRKAKLSSLAAFGGVSTLVTIFAGVFFGGETLYYYHIIGTVLIFTRIIGVSVIDIKKSRLQKTE
jgi:drug/metabolite transporter (DMT)-like permease